MKPDYRNWVPRSMVLGLLAGTAITSILFVVLGMGDIVQNTVLRAVFAVIFGAGTLVLLFFTVWMYLLHRAFDYNGPRKLSKTIIDGVSSFVHIPDGGTGLDVGCGSGALTIACAKRNPDALMVGCDIWSGAYKAVYGKELCESNAKAEGVSNIGFEEGNAVSLPYPDETFDAVTSNYVYHNIAGKDKQELLLETLRVLKKGGTFAIHDIMTPLRYGDMEAFVRKLKDQGYEDVRLIDTADGMFMEKKEAKWMDLAGSTLLVGRK